MKARHIPNWVAIILGVMLGGAVVLILHVTLFAPNHETGCPTPYDQSVEDAQVFLMGTIGGDYSDPNRDCWRENIVQPALAEMGVTFFNPVVEEWDEENARTEARVIAQAETLVLVITEKHTSFGSLSESGWAVLSALERDQTVILYIESDHKDTDSWRSRQIVLSQAQTLAPNINQLRLVDSLADVVTELEALYANR